MLEHFITWLRIRKVEGDTPSLKNLALPCGSLGHPSPIRPTRPCRQGHYSVLAFETAAFFWPGEPFFSVPVTLWGGVSERIAQEWEKRLVGILQLFFKPRRAVTIAAGPGLGAVLVAAFAAVMRVLHFNEVKILFPVRRLFLERRGAVEDLDPPR